MKRVRSHGRATIAASACAMPVQALAQATFTGLGLLPGTVQGYASSLSADGLTASGTCTDLTTNRAFRWRNGVLDDIGIPIGAVYSEGGPLTPDGNTMAGTIGPPQRPARWTAGGALQDLGFPANTNHLPFSISADGATIWGFGGNSPITPRVYRWTAATSHQYMDLPQGYAASAGGFASADGSIVVGSALGGAGSRPVRWANGVPGLLTLPPGVTQGDALAVSADGLVITGTMKAGDINHAFRWTQLGGTEDLGGSSAIAFGTSADGSVIVGRDSTGGSFHAVLWTRGTGMVDLSSRLASAGANLTGWVLDSALRISADGRTILGQGTHNGVQEAWIATIPDPCYPNCDDSFSTPTLTGNDFVCFLIRYVAGDPRANCDQSTVTPVLTANDFSCFLTSFAAGCS